MFQTTPNQTFQWKSNGAQRFLIFGWLSPVPYFFGTILGRASKATIYNNEVWTETDEHCWPLGTVFSTYLILIWSIASPWHQDFSEDKLLIIFWHPPGRGSQKDARMSTPDSGTNLPKNPKRGLWESLFSFLKLPLGVVVRWNQMDHLDSFWTQMHHLQKREHH